MKYTRTLSRLLLLGGLAFLGFYVYGLVMGVFSPGERTAIMRDPHDQRERRGF